MHTSSSLPHRRWLLMPLIAVLFTLQACQRDATAILVDNLKDSIPAPFTAIDEHKGTIILALATVKDSIGLLERAEANIVVARQPAFFQRLLNAINQVQGGQVRLHYQAEGTQDVQDFDYDSEKLTPIVKNPEQTIQQAEEELQLLREAELQ